MRFTAEMKQPDCPFFELITHTSLSLVNNIYAEMRKMKFVDVANSLNFLMFLDDERKLNKFIERISTITQLRAASRE